MQIFRAPDIKVHGVYTEFLRVPAMSLGIYHHRAGTGVVQDPHLEDEVYVVLSGTGMVRVNEEDQTVSNGSIVYVPAGVPHCFHSVSEDLQVLVLFAPPEGSTNDS